MTPLDETQPPGKSLQQGSLDVSSQSPVGDAGASLDDTCSLAAGSSLEYRHPPADLPVGFSQEHQSEPVAVAARHFGNYELLERIGKGGMGVVFKARQVGLNRIVALKRIRADELGEAEQIQRFYAEAEAAAALDHSGIVPIHEVGHFAGQPFFSMGYVAGPSLQQRLAQGPLNPRQAASIVQQVAEAVEYAHQRGIIHRDLKPGNILLDEEGHPRVTDFGLAKRTAVESGLTLTGQVLGTPAYMPPEQARGEQVSVGPRSDVYGLGAVLYALLTGRPPFLAASFVETLRHVVEDEPAVPRALNASIPVDLESITLKCLEKDPERRYTSSAELAADLDRYLAGEPVRARPISQAALAWRWCRRHQTQAALLAMFILSLVLGSAVSTWFGIVSRHETSRADKAAKAADLARGEAQEKLRVSLLAQAQASRFGTQVGRRGNALRAIAEAARIRPGLDLRNEAIACMALVDLHVAREWDGCPGGPSEVPCLSFDLELNRYARSDQQGNICVRSVDGDKEIVTLPGNGEPAYLIQFSPDGRCLAASYKGAMSGAPDGYVSLWNLAESQEIMHLSGHANWLGLDFSPDSQLLATANYEGRKSGTAVYSTVDGSKVTEVSPDTAYGICFDPRGERLAICVPHKDEVQIREVATGALLHALSSPKSGNAAWHPDGELLAVTDGSSIRLWNTTTGSLDKPINAHPHSTIESLAFNHAGNLLASLGKDHRLAIWDPYSGRRVLLADNVQLRGTRPRLQFSRDDRSLGYSIRGSKVELWEVAQPQACQQLFGIGGSDAAFHPAGRVAAAAAKQEGILLWDLARSKPIALLPSGGHGVCQSIHFDLQGRTLFSGMSLDGICRFPIEAIQDSHWTLGPTQANWAKFANGAVLSRDGKRMGAADFDSSTAYVIDVDDPLRQVSFQGHERVASVALSPDQQWVATGTRAGLGVKVWNGKTGDFVCELPEKLYDTEAIDFSPDGQWLLTGNGEEYSLWEVGTWRLARRMPTSREDRNPAAFSPDGSLLAIASEANTLKLIETANGDEIATLIPPDDQPFGALRFGQDGTRLAVSASGVLQVWDLRAVRAELSQMRLDWPLPPYPQEATPLELPPALVVEIIDGELYRKRGSQHAAAGRWREAHEQFRQARAVDSDGADASAYVHTSYLFDAVALLAIGEEAEYKQLCEEFLKRMANSTVPNPNHQRAIAHISTIGPDAVSLERWPQIRAVAERLAEAQPLSAFSHELLGAVCFRSGDFQAAIEHLQRAVEIAKERPAPPRWDANGSPWTKLFLAMAHQRAGNPGEAQRWLRMGVDAPSLPMWTDRKIIELLLAEARRL
jgi:WD40 repeat protein/tRNA A-37 threonylcarbamoyl transferase component Bud32